MDARYIYPPIEVQSIAEYDASTSTHFLVDRVENACDQRMCFSVSLFKRNPNNSIDGEFPVDEDAWKHRYLNGLLRNIQQIQRMEMRFKIRIYLARDLDGLCSLLIAAAPEQVEIYVMHSSSIGHGPGALWRFLALSDRSLDVVAVSDIDEPLNKVYIETLASAPPGVILCKHAAENPQLHVHNGKVWGQYNLFQAGKFAMRPVQLKSPQLNFQTDVIHSMVCGLTQYAINQRFQIDSGETVFNVPRAGHPHGWGRHPYIYGFDETFLKCVLYPLITRSQVVLVGDPDPLELSILHRGPPSLLYPSAFT